MKQLLLFLLTIQIIPANGQGVIGDQKNAMIEAYDLSGKRIPMGETITPEGNKMLSDQFVVGAVKFAGVQSIYHLMVNFSLLDNELFFKKDSMVLAFVNPVDSFSITAKDHGVDKTMNFKCGYPDIGGNTEKSFYQVIENGPKIQLLKYLYKIKEDKYRYGGPVEKAYVDRAKLFIYDGVNKAMYKINLAAKSIKKALTDYAPLVEQFTAKNKIKNEEDLVALVSFLNTGVISD